MMHNKFAIIDEEAVITGSLNWTRQVWEWKIDFCLISEIYVLIFEFVLSFRAWKVTMKM